MAASDSVQVSSVSASAIDHISDDDNSLSSGLSVTQHSTSTVPNHNEKCDISLNSECTPLNATYASSITTTTAATLNYKSNQATNLREDVISTTSSLTKQSTANTGRSLRQISISLSLYTNILILFTKLVAYLQTLSLSVLASLTDSLLDVISQLVLDYTERHSTKDRSSALYPAGAARLEPVGVLTCAALMGFASFEIVKESVQALIENEIMIERGQDLDLDWKLSSVWGMLVIIAVKFGLWKLCTKAMQEHSRNLDNMTLCDPTLDALAQDHWNDALSNAVAAMALVAAYTSPDLWFVDPVGAIFISLYIIYSWYETGKEQIEQLTGKSAPRDYLDEIKQVASAFHDKMEVDVCRAYHFGPKFLVELECVLPRDTILMESHDLGMELQYEIEGREEVERCFVHLDYERRAYDEHVVSKVPELVAKYRPSASTIHSV